MEMPGTRALPWIRPCWNRRLGPFEAAHARTTADVARYDAGRWSRDVAVLGPRVGPVGRHPPREHRRLVAMAALASSLAQRFGSGDATADDDGDGDGDGDDDGGDGDGDDGDGDGDGDDGDGDGDGDDGGDGGDGDGDDGDGDDGGDDGDGDDGDGDDGVMSPGDWPPAPRGTGGCHQRAAFW